MKKESSGAGAAVMKTTSSGAGAMFMKRRALELDLCHFHNGSIALHGRTVASQFQHDCKD